jgi:hypothetical protein
MKKKDLAIQLGKCLLANKLVEPEVLQQVSDNKVIDSCITCSRCKMKLVKNPKKLAKIVGKSRTIEHFFYLCDKYQHQHLERLAA